MAESFNSYIKSFSQVARAYLFNVLRLFKDRYTKIRASKSADMHNMFAVHFLASVLRAATYRGDLF